MHNIWILVADSSQGRIFEVVEPTQQIRQIENFIHSVGRKNNRELQSDANGRYFGKNGQSHTASAQINPAEHEMELFTKILSKRLEKGRIEHSFDRLHIIAPPKFLGLLRKNLSKETKKLVEEEQPKDLSWFNPKEIKQYLH